MQKKIALTTARKKVYIADANTMNYWRRNLCIAAQDLLGVFLSDSQSWVMQGTATAEKAWWACSRAWGKSFMIAVYCILRSILYPNQKIYIISSVGNQAKHLACWLVIISIIRERNRRKLSMLLEKQHICQHRGK